MQTLKGKTKGVDRSCMELHAAAAARAAAVVAASAAAAAVDDATDGVFVFLV